MGDDSKKPWSKSRAEWISAARAEIRKSRKAIDDLEEVISRLEKKQERQEYDFRVLMRALERREPKPQDYGLRPGWRPQKGPDDFGMGRWVG